MSKARISREKNTSRTVGEDQSDKYSETSTDHSQGTTEDESLSLDDIKNISQSIENLADKRAKIRLEGLQNLLKFLRSSKTEVFSTVLTEKDNIADSLSQLLRKGISSEKEGLLVVEVYAVLSLYMGSNEQEYLDIFQPYLMNISTRCQYEHLRSSSLMAISFSHLLCSNLIDYNIVTFIEDVLCKVSEALDVSQLLQSTAALAWCLLSTAMSRQDIIDRSRERVFEEIVNLLFTGSIDVKIVAGLCLAYLWEVACSNEDETSHLEPCQIGLILCTDSELVSRMIDELQKIAKDCSKRVSKKDRKEQRTAFREVQAWIINGERPDDTIHFQGAVVECTTFSKMIFLDAIRGVLGDGFTGAVRLFPVVRDLLEVDTVTDHMDGDGTDKKIKKGSAVSRTRTTQRKQDRSYRNNNKQFEAFTLDEEGEST